MTLHEALYHGTYTDYFSGERVTFDGPATLNIEAWGYRVFVG